MPIVKDFEYYRPGSVEAALDLLSQYPGRARLLAGGTDLTVYLKEGLVKPDAVIDIKDIAALKGLREENGTLWIGAVTTFSELLQSELIKRDYLLLWEAASWVASVGIRNRATLVGNICSAVPSLDSAPALLCYEAVVQVQDRNGKREIPIGDWFLAPRKTALRPDEIVLSVTLCKPPIRHTGCYLKLGRYNGEDLAQAGLGILQTSENLYRFAHCAVGPIPRRMPSVENLLNGEELTSCLMVQAKELLAAEISPITDIRSSKEYRMQLCKVMLERGLEAVRDRLAGKTVNTRSILGG